MITELKPDQDALIPGYREKWQAVALSIERINQQKVVSAINAAYSLFEMGEPEIIFCDSPYEAYMQLKDTPLYSLAGSFDEWIKDKQHVRLMEQVPRGFWAKTVSRLSVNHVWTALEPFYEKVGVFILDELEGQIFPSLAPERWVSSACWFDFFVTVLNCEHLSEEWKVFQELTLECGWLFPFEGVCVVCNRPTKLTFDKQFRLHADEGSAIEFSDGFCIYARHGKLVIETDRSTGDNDMS